MWNTCTRGTWNKNTHSHWCRGNSVLNVDFGSGSVVNDVCKTSYTCSVPLLNTFPRLVDHTVALCRGMWSILLHPWFCHRRVQCSTFVGIVVQALHIKSSVMPMLPFAGRKFRKIPLHWFTGFRSRSVQVPTCMWSCVLELARHMKCFQVGQDVLMQWT